MTECYGDLVDALTDHFGWKLKRLARANVAPDHDEPIDEAFRARIASDNTIDMELYEHARQLVTSRWGRP